MVALICPWKSHEKLGPSPGNLLRNIGSGLEEVALQNVQNHPQKQSEQVVKVGFRLGFSEWTVFCGVLVEFIGVGPAAWPRHTRDDFV
jgi:hypothetical protein